MSLCILWSHKAEFCSSRTLGKMIRATLLPDLTYCHRGGGGKDSRPSLGVASGDPIKKCVSPPLPLLGPSSALVIPRSKRLFIIGSARRSDPPERERGNREPVGGRVASSPAAFICQISYFERGRETSPVKGRAVCIVWLRV